MATQLPTRGWKGGAGRARVGAAAAAEDNGRLREVEWTSMRMGMTGRVVVKARPEERLSILVELLVCAE